MSLELAIASSQRGGAMAMLGIAVLIGAVIGLLSLLRGRRPPKREVDATAQWPDASDRARSANDRSTETSERSPAA